MIKKATILILVLLIAAISLSATANPVPLPEVNKPNAFYFDNQRLFIVEGYSVYIYSLKDFKLIKKFGKLGEGPREFKLAPFMMGQVFIDVSSDDIIVSSMGKLSFWTKDGVFKKEIRFVSPQTRLVRPFDKKYVGVTTLFADDKMYEALYLLEPDMKLGNNLAKVEGAFQMGKGLTVMKHNPTQVVYKNKLYIAWENALKIQVMDTSLKKLNTIQYKLEPVKVTADDKKKIIQFLKTAPEIKNYFQFMQPIRFPEFYPAILGMTITDNLIYILTFNSEGDDDVQKNEFLIFDLNGKFKKRLFKPTKMMTPLVPYPFKIHKGKFYQLIENEDEEQWELHANDLK